MRYAFGRFTYLLFILLAVTFLVSTMLELMPGEPAYIIIGEEADEEQIEALNKRLGLDKPVLERYAGWLGNAVTGDLGRSSSGNIPVAQLIRQRLPVTIQLVIGSQLLALAFAVPSAIYSSYRSGGFVDQASSAMSFAMISVPHFVLAVLLILIFGVNLGWLPTAGFVPITENFANNMRSMVMPTIAVAAGPAGIYQRLLRSDMTATLREDYIAMAEAKGQSPTRILLRHALRPSMFSLMTLVGLTTAAAIGGSVVVEVIFGLPGIGRLLINSIERRDVVVLQGVVAFIGVGYVALNGFVDILYGVLDPRVRRG
jgi:peptide/nickel transport system permease protein